MSTTSELDNCRIRACSVRGGGKRRGSITFARALYHLNACVTPSMSSRSSRPPKAKYAMYGGVAISMPSSTPVSTRPALSLPREILSPFARTMHVQILLTVESLVEQSSILRCTLSHRYLDVGGEYYDLSCELRDLQNANELMTAVSR